MNEVRAELQHVIRARACTLRITSNKRVGARGQKRGALLVLHAIAVVSDHNVVESSAKVDESLCIKALSSTHLGLASNDA